MHSIQCIWVPTYLPICKAISFNIQKYFLMLPSIHLYLYNFTFWSDLPDFFFLMKVSMLCKNEPKIAKSLKFNFCSCSQCYCIPYSNNVMCVAACNAHNTHVHTSSTASIHQRWYGLGRTFAIIIFDKNTVTEKCLSFITTLSYSWKFLLFLICLLII